MTELRQRDAGLTHSAPSARLEEPRLMVGRHPILNRRRQIFGYELRFCPTAPGASSPDAGVAAMRTTPLMDDASARILADHVMSVGLDRLTHGSRAFIELPLPSLSHIDVRALPPGEVVLQVPCDGPIDDATIEVCRSLKRDGMQLRRRASMTPRTPPI